MLLIINLLLASACAYLLGSVLSAVWCAWCFSLPDPRGFGSKNPGTTNIARTKRPYAKFAALMTLLLDVLKGYIPAYTIALLGYTKTCVLLVGSMAVIGHIFPIYYRFNGGKGMATALGVLMVLSWEFTLLNSCVWAVSYYVFRIASVSSIISVLTLPVLFLYSDQFYLLSPCVLLLSIFIIYKHLSNIYVLSLEAFLRNKESFKSALLAMF